MASGLDLNIVIDRFEGFACLSVSGANIDRRANVAIVLRNNPSTLKSEILLLCRAINERDYWSGDVCFPGGHQEPSESALESAIRETLEETGINLNDREHFRCLGQFSERVISRGWPSGRKLLLSSFVFVQRSLYHLPVRLQHSEIAGYRWVPTSFFTEIDNFVPHHTDKKYWKLVHPSKRMSHPRVVRVLGLCPLLFRCITLPIPVTDDAHIQGEPQDSTHAFILWGLTLGIVSDFLSRVNRRQSSISLPFATSPYYLTRIWLRFCTSVMSLYMSPRDISLTKVLMWVGVLNTCTIICLVMTSFVIAGRLIGVT